jgi:hypothetical protein
MKRIKRKKKGDKVVETKREENDEDYERAQNGEE